MFEEAGARVAARRRPVKYILMMQFNVEGWDRDNTGTWQPRDIKANLDFLRNFHKDLTECGELVGHQGLGGPEAMKMVRASKDGTPAVTDGPFPESKEFLAGYWIVDVETPEQAYDIAARASAAPGSGGAPMNMSIEVRQVMSGPPDDLL
jgi:hypothetical protein